MDFSLILKFLLVIIGLPILIYAGKKMYLSYIKTKDYPKEMLVIAIIGFSLAFTGWLEIMKAFRSGDSKTSSSSTQQTNKKISCMKCGKDLTNDNNRISPNSNDNYYCTPCYIKVKKEIDEELKQEGYK